MTFVDGADGKCSIILLTMVLVLLTGIKALSEVDVTVPQAAAVGDTIALQCHYTLENNEPLYTLKWYKGAREFYRFIPKEHPNTQVFPLSGINVDLDKSDRHTVVLSNVQPEITGKYKCEVSTDAPNFYTNMKSAYMYVIDVPTAKPQIQIKNSFELGQSIRANCTSPASYPAMNLTWFVNGIKVNESYHTQIPLPHRNSVKVRIGLEHFIDPKSYQSGKLHLQCVATLFNLYKKEDEINLGEDRPKPRPSSVLGTPNSGSIPSGFFFPLVQLIYFLR